MKSSPIPTPSGVAPPVSEAERHGRRRVVVGAGVAAGAALVAAALPRTREPEAQAAAAATGQPPAEGYRLTDHIQRYYETLRS
jgi:hypothetical protein